MLQLVKGPVAPPNEALCRCVLEVERMTLAKRLWRGTAADGTEFGFELAAPLKHGETFFETTQTRYLIEQRAETVVEVSLDLAPSAAAGIGWAIGNLHLELSAEPTRLLAPDEPAVRQLLQRLQVPFKSTLAVFRPGRFARGNITTSVHELGQSHQH